MLVIYGILKAGILVQRLETVPTVWSSLQVPATYCPSPDIIQKASVIALAILDSPLYWTVEPGQNEQKEFIPSTSAFSLVAHKVCVASIP